MAAVFVREVPGSYPVPRHSNVIFSVPNACIVIKNTLKVSRKLALSVGYNFKCFCWRGGELGSQNRFFKNGTHQPLKSSLSARVGKITPHKREEMLEIRKSAITIRSTEE